MTTPPLKHALRPRTWSLNTRQWLMLILTVHFLLALAYSIVIPPWEAHDEWAHYSYSAYLLNHHALPNPSENINKVYINDEASQPPLYYLLAAIPMALANTQDGYAPEANSYFHSDSAVAGINAAVHNPDTENFPWHGTLLAMHLGRLASLLISLLALLITYRILRFLSPNRPEIALIGTAIQAFAPEFIFLSAVITNDILVVAVESLLLYYSLLLIEKGPTWRLTAYAAVAAGLSLLTKYLAVAVIPMAGLAFGWGAWRHRKTPGMLRNFLISSATAIILLVALVSAFMWRTHKLTGHWIMRDVNTLQSFFKIFHGGAFHWDYLPRALVYGFQTYWVSFGWGNLSPHAWVYWAWLGVIVLGTAGFLWWLVIKGTPRDRRMTLFLTLFVLAAVSVPLFREVLLDRPYLRGRFLLVTLPVVGWMLAQGWAMLSNRVWKLTRWGLALWPLVLSAWLIPGLIIPAYAQPEPLARLPRENIIPVDVRFGHYAELLAARLYADDEVAIGDQIAVTLYWNILARTSEPYAVAINLVGADHQNYGGIVSYPGNGNAPTSGWRTESLMQDTYWFAVQSERPLPTSAHIEVSLYNPGAMPEYLPTFDRPGNPVSGASFGSLRIDSDEKLPVSTKPILANFDQLLSLTEVTILPTPQRAGGVMPVALTWRALGPAPEDTLLSLQLLDEQGEWVAGMDGAVSNVLLPQHWRTGDVIETARWLPLPDTLPPGRYKLLAVLYHAGDLSRIPATDSTGQPLANNAYPMGDVQITAKP